MIDYLISLFVNRRKGDGFHWINRRRTTVKQARCMLAAATENFSETVTLHPERVKNLLKERK